MADTMDDEARSVALALAAVGLTRAAESLGGARPGAAHELPEYRALRTGLATESVPDYVSYLGSIMGSRQELELSAALLQPEDLDDAATALLAALLSTALRQDPGSHWFYYWNSETLRAALPRSGMTGVADRIRREIEERLTLGINLRGRSDREFLAGVRQVEAHDAEAHDSPALGLLRVLLQTTSFCSSDLERSLDLAAQTPGAPLLQAMILGLFNGAFYGRQRLAEHWPELLLESDRKGHCG